MNEHSETIKPTFGVNEIEMLGFFLKTQRSPRPLTPSGHPSTQELKTQRVLWFFYTKPKETYATDPLPGTRPQEN